jgi:ankyrin repeat protein
MLTTMTCNPSVFRGEIHEAIQLDDLTKVRALLKENHRLSSIKDEYGKTPLHNAVNWGSKDVIEMLRQNGGHE